MIVVRDGDASASEQGPAVLAIGVFDGLHLGHQMVIAKVRALAEQLNATSTVVTFDPHPAWVLAPDRAPSLLGTLDQRLEGLDALGVEQVRVLRFDEGLASEDALSFIDRVVVGQLHAVEVVVGRDFRFGHDRTGDVKLLEREGRRRGFGVFASPIHGTPTRWSSTVVRRALADGELELANATLGRPFTLRGTVVHGDARGGDLGFPTANLELAPRQQLPSTGIYAGAVRTAPATWWPAAISVGTRPQFYENGQLLVEVHVAGLDHDLYGQVLDVCFLERLRGEATYAGVEELIAQIELDVAQTVALFKGFSPNASALLE